MNRKNTEPEQTDAEALNVLIQLGLVDVVNVNDNDVTVRIARRIIGVGSTCSLE